MSFGFGFGLPSWQTLSGGFSPASLFSAGEQGAWYDPSDFSTLFTDSAGTTPVSAPGNGADVWVGLMLDKSKGLVGSTKYGEVFGASGAAGNYFSSPDSSAASITGDIDIRIKASLDDWTPALERYLVSKWAATGGGNTSYLVGLTASGALTLTWSTTGSNTISRTSTATLGLSDGATKWVRCTLDVDNGAGGHDVKFFTSNDGSAWVQLGSTVTTAGTTSIFDSAAAVNVAGFNSGTVNSIQSGKYYRVQILNGIDGAVAVDFDPTKYVSGSTFTSATGEVWTLNGSTRIVPDGNHAFQTQTAKRPKLAARYNLLTHTEQFDNAAWTKSGLNAFGSGSVANTTATTDPLGGNTADFIQENNSAGTHEVVYSNFPVSASTRYTCSVRIKAAGRSWCQFVLGPSTYFGSGGIGAYFDITNGTVGTVTSNATALPVASITSLGNGWYQCSLSATSNAASGTADFNVRIAQNGSTVSYTGDGTSGIYIWGADLRPASQATGLIGPTYQRVVDAATYDAVGFLPYLEFNGLSWSMSTGSIDFTATDKMTVWAGVRKLSAINTGVAETICELSTSIAVNNGAFVLWHNNGTDRINFASKGTTRVDATTTDPIYNSLNTVVITGQADISAPNIVLRADGVQLDQDSASQGTGNYGNYPLFIGARNNAGSYFNGWLTSLIIRGAQSTQSQIEATESWVNGKTGAY